MAFLGNSHYGIEDAAVMRAIPNLTVVCPADCAEIVKTVQAAAHFQGPMYIRLTGAVNNPVVYSEDYEFTIGKAIWLREGRDVTLIAHGTMVYESLEAAKLLEAEGVSAAVLNMHTLKPLDTEALDKALAGSRAIVTVEEHSLIGGLGDDPGDGVHLGVGEIRIDRQAQDLAGHPAGHRQKMGLRRGQPFVHREVADQGVEIAPGVNVAAGHKFIQCVAADRIIVAHQDGEVGIVGGLASHPVDALDAWALVQQFTVALIDDAPALDGLVDILQLQEPERGIELAHLAVDAGGHHGGFVGEAKVLQVVDAVLGLGIGADDGPTFKGIENLGGMKAEDGQVAVVEHTAGSGFHAERMGGVVNHLEVVVIGNFLDAVYIAGVPVAVHWQNGRGLGGDGGFDLARVQIQRFFVDVHEHRFDPVPEQRMGGGHKGVRGGDHLPGDAQ